MAAPSVTFQGTRINDAEALGTVWFDLTAKAAVLEPDIVFQNTYSVSDKVGTSEMGIMYYNSGSSVDYSGTRRVAIIKHTATNPGALSDTASTAGILEIGTGQRTNYYRYYVVRKSTWPSTTSWLITPIDPFITAYADATVLSPTLTTINYYGWACTFTAASKSENVAMDAIDYVPYGSGLLLVGGDGVSTDATFADFVTNDEGTRNNRWGLATAKAGINYALGTWTIGSATETDFTDSFKTVVWPTGRFGTSFAGLKFDLGNANSVMSVTSCTFVGEGVRATNDTRPDWTVTNTSGSATFTGCNFISFNLMTTNSKTTVSSCSFVKCEKLTPAQGTFDNCNFIQPTNLVSTAFMICVDPADITNCSFESGGTGHAIELTTKGTYAFTGNSFTGYSSTDGTAGTEVVYNNVTVTTVDSYSETNQSTDVALGNGTTTAAGQTFASGTGEREISACRFYLKKNGSPTGNITAKVYATSAGIPTGSALASSTTYSAASLTTSYALIDFRFRDSANVITLTSSTTYAIVLEYSGGDASNYVQVGADNTSPGHSGQLVTYASSTWTGTAGTDACFYMYTGGAVILNVTGGSGTISIREKTGTATTVATSATLTIKLVDADGNTITDTCEVTIVRSSDDFELYNDGSITTGQTSYAYSSGGGTTVYINVINATAGGYQPKTVNGYVLPSSGTTTLTIQLDDDPFYNNPA